MAKLLKLGANSVGFCIPRDTCQLLGLDVDTDCMVRIQIDEANNDFDNKDLLNIKIGWVKWKGGSVFDD